MVFNLPFKFNKFVRLEFQNPWLLICTAICLHTNWTWGQSLKACKIVSTSLLQMGQFPSSTTPLLLRHSLTTMLLWAHCHRKDLMRGRVGAFQIQLAVNVAAFSLSIASLYALFKSKLPFEFAAYTSLSPLLPVNDSGVAWSTCLISGWSTCLISGGKTKGTRFQSILESTMMSLTA